MRKITATMLHAIGPLVSEGHYLNRLILLCELFELYPLARLLDSARLYADHNCKAPGVDAVMVEASEAIIHLATIDHKLPPEALRPIAWALEHEALKRADLLFLRLEPGYERTLAHVGIYRLKTDGREFWVENNDALSERFKTRNEAEMQLTNWLDDDKPQPDPSRHTNTRDDRWDKIMTETKALVKDPTKPRLALIAALAEENAADPTKEEIAARIRAKNGGPK